uniref:Uncharacterized protein n=1 Tax=viral metagenome TaxID=1070528 RepID=A0A2V0RA89_9ZZZZ
MSRSFRRLRRVVLVRAQSQTRGRDTRVWVLQHVPRDRKVGQLEVNPLDRENFPFEKLVIIASYSQHSTFFHTRKSELNADIVEDITDICDVLLHPGDDWIDYFISLPYPTVVVIPRTLRWEWHIDRVFEYAQGPSPTMVMDVHRRLDMNAISRVVSDWRRDNV